MKQEIIDCGDRVQCDVCSKEFLADNQTSGGFLFEGYAYCPECAVTRLPKIKSYGEEKFIKARCPEGKSFRDWVLQDLRKGDNRAIFTTYD